MSYINNLKVSEGGLSKRQVNALTKELDKLLEMYSDVEIKEIRSNVIREKDDESIKLGENSYAAGTYVYEDKLIKINLLYFLEHQKPLSKTEYLKKRRELRKKLKKRIGMGIDVEVGRVLNSKYKCLENTLRHEFAHALDHMYDFENNKDIINIYESLTEKDILREISQYATTNIKEFICECFAESFMNDCSKLAKDVRKIIDRVGRR